MDGYVHRDGSTRVLGPPVEVVDHTHNLTKPENRTEPVAPEETAT